MPPARYATAREATAPTTAGRPSASRQSSARQASTRPASARPASARQAPTRSPRHPRQAPALSWVHGRAQIQRVRWDRVGRVALVIVLAVVALLYIEHTVEYFQARSQADHQQAIVTRLEHQNAALVRQQNQLNNPATIVKDARELGMVWMGERPYAVNGLPNH